MLFTFWRTKQGIREAKPRLNVLNTIDEVTPAPPGDEIRGECSPFITR